MATVTIDAEQWDRVREYADRAYEEISLMVYHRGAVGAWNARCQIQPGDLDPIAPDPEEPSVEAMMDALVGEGMVLAVFPELWPSSVVGTGERCNFCNAAIVPGTYCPGGLSATRRGEIAKDWQTALRAAYAQVVGEEG